MPKRRRREKVAKRSKRQKQKEVVGVLGLRNATEVRRPILAKGGGHRKPSTPVRARIHARKHDHKHTHMTIKHDIQRALGRFTRAFLNNESSTEYAIPDHFRAQTQFICERNGTCPALAFIGNMANMERGWNEVLVNRFGVELYPSSSAWQHGLRKGRLLNLTLSTSDQKSLCEVYKHDYCCFHLPFPSACWRSRCDAPKRDIVTNYWFVEGGAGIEEDVDGNLKKKTKHKRGTTETEWRRSHKNPRRNSGNAARHS